jgi:RNA polymerase sigma-70 factor (ECF subfamily)
MKSVKPGSLLLNEQECIEAVKKGVREAYSMIVKTYMKKAYYISLSFVKNEQDALDLSQDAFIKAYRHIKKFKSDRQFFPWFYQILKNLCFDWLKKNRNRDHIPLENAIVSGQGQTDELIKIQLWKAIGKLPQDQREAVILRYFHGFNYTEIAKMLDKPVGTIMSSLYYAKKRLRQKMESKINEP